MQSQPFIIERLNDDRRADLYMAAAETRRTRYSGQGATGSRIAQLLKVLRVRRPSLHRRTGTAATQPVTSR